jgi:hypothetical protein
MCIQQQQMRLATSAQGCKARPARTWWGGVSHLHVFALRLPPLSFEAVKLPLEQLQRKQTQDMIRHHQQQQQQKQQQSNCCW